MEATTNPVSSEREDAGFLLNLFPELAGEFPLNLCPESIRLVAGDVSAVFKTSSVPAVAAALALAATAIGPRQRLRLSPRTTVTAGFNLLVARLQPRLLQWLDILQSRLLGRVAAMQRALHGDGEYGTRNLLAQYERDLNATRESHEPDPELIRHVMLEMARLRARLKSNLILSAAGPKEILAAAAKAFDGGILCTTLGTDPLDDLALLKAEDRRQLAQWLNVQWEESVIPYATALSEVTVLWHTQARSLDHLARWREFHAGTLPVPLLVQLDTSDPFENPGVLLPNEPAWVDVIDSLFDRRCVADEHVYALASDAQKPFQEFELHLRRNLHLAPPEFRSHLAWLPGLAPRLSLLFHLLEGGTELEIPSTITARATTIARWLGGRHLQALVSALPVRPQPYPTDGTAITADTDAAAVMFGKIAAKAPISRRQLWRAYNRPRAESFNQTLDALIGAGKVQWNQDAKLVPVPGRQ
jgi:hypothetical protein